MKQTIILATIFVALTVTLIPAYAEEVEIPFVADSSSCQYSYDAESNQFKYACLWSMTPTDEEIAIIAEDEPELIPEHIVDEAIESIEAEKEAQTIEDIVADPEKIAEIEEIKDLQEIIEDYGSGKVDIEELCFGGTVREATVVEQYATIDIKRPNDNVKLSTNQQFKYEHLLSEICKAEYKLEFKVKNHLRTMPGEGEQYVFVPMENFDALYPNATLAYEAAKQTDLFMQSEQIRAEQFQCSSPGKAQGHCVKAVSDQPEPEPKDYMSIEGKASLAKWEAYLQTGETELPQKDQEQEPDLTFALEQYIDAYGITEEQLKEWFEARQP